MIAHITYIKFLDNEQKQEINRIMRFDMTYSDRDIRRYLMRELMMSGLKNCDFESCDFADNAFDVYKPLSNDKLFEVFWLTQYSFFDRLKLKLFPMHYAKKGAK